MKNMCTYTSFYRRKLFLFLLIISPILSREAMAQITPDQDGTVYVSHQANGNGSSWANAAAELSEALATAQTNTNIRIIKIAQGTYYPTGTQSSTNRTVSFAINRGGLKLYGGYNAATGQRDAAGFPTILSGNIGSLSDNTDNSYHVMVISGLAANADSVVVDGVTIRDGLANGGEAESFRRGGGLIIENCQNEWKVAIRNCAILSNMATDFGGGAWIHQSAPVLANCRVENNKSEGIEESRGGGLAFIQASGEIKGGDFVSNTTKLGGGAIYNNRSSLTIEESDFSENIGDYGGAILNQEEPSALTISDCNFEENHARANGGSMFNNRAFLKITSSSFLKNSSDLLGGAVGNDRLSDNSMIIDCFFSENSAAENGGALHNIYTSIKIEKCNFNKNSTQEHGGAVHNHGSGDKYILDCLFSENTAAKFGGAIRNNATPCRIEKCEFIKNNAQEYGGAISNVESGDKFILDCLFSENTTTFYGGAMLNFDTHINIEKCKFNKNSTQEDGGAIYNFGSGDKFFSECLFNENIATQFGGAIYNNATSSRIEKCEFIKNNAQEYGGAVSNTGPGDKFFLDCLFSENTATYYGGAILSFETHINVEKCEFNKNSAGQLGGALYSDGLVENSRISNSKFLENTAGEAGGAVVKVSSIVDIKGCEFIKNRSSNQSGAMVIANSNNAAIVSCTFKGNESPGLIGALLIKNCASSQVANCLFSGNYSGENGSALVFNTTNSSIINSTFSANYAPGMGTIVASASSSVDVANSIVLFNGSGQGAPGFVKDETSSISYRDGVYDGFTTGQGIVDYRSYTTGAFREVPDFNTAPTTAGDLRPSPVFWSFIGRGNNSLLPTDLTSDIAGRPRIHNGTVDLGAYEYQGLPFDLSEIYVDANATGSGTGFSWANAAPGLKEGLAIAEESPHADVIYVAGGTYYPTDGTDRDAAFVLPKRSIRLLGGYDASTGVRNPAVTPTILSGDIGDRDVPTDNSYHVLVVAGLGADSTIIDDFTIRDGTASGDGEHSYNGIPTYRSWGGGIFATNDEGTGQLAIRNCIVSSSFADDYGGGICNYNTSMTVINSLIHGNRAAYGGGIVHVPKAGHTIVPKVIQSTIAGNHATTRGGGIDNFANSQLSLINTLVYTNNSGLGGGSSMVYTAAHSLIQGRSDMSNGNLDGTVAYPEMFVSAAGQSSAPTSLGDYRPTAQSPVIDKGNNDVANQLATDLSFYQRIVEDQVDIGAYEFFCTEDILASGGTTVGIDVAPGQRVRVGKHCDRIGAVEFPLLQNYVGTMIFRTWLADNVLEHGPARFVPRYHALTSATSVNVPVKVTLYYSNSDFKTYNESYGNTHNAKLPDNDEETPVLDNLRIAHYIGAGSGDYLPESYPGARLMHPANVSWNEELQLWEVTFETQVFSGFFVTGQSDDALPVTLLSFTAQKAESGVLLSWQTTQEKDFSHFQVERSPEGRFFDKIAQVTGGEPDGRYSFTDYRPEAGTNYYRIRMVDQDGSFSYSRIESVGIEGANPAWAVYPNPSSRVQPVKVTTAGLNVKAVTVYDLAGMEVEASVRLTPTGDYELDFGRLSAGVYLITVVQESGLSTRKAIID